MKLLNKKELFFISIIFVCLCTSSAMLIYDLFFAEKIRTGEQVGTISYKNKSAEQKQGGSSLWMSLALNAPVYNKDTIRTGRESTAVIHLNNQTDLTLSEESMVIIDIIKNTPTIQLNSGFLAVSTTDTSPVNLKTPSGNIAIKGGSLKIQESQSGYTIQLIDGKSEITTDSSSTPVKMNKNDTFDIQTQKASQPEVILVLPQQNAYIISEESHKNMTFRWEKRQDLLEKNSQLLIAKDKNFTDIEYKATGIESEITIPISEGIHYWKVSNSNEIRAFTIKKGQEPTIFSPSNELFTLVDQPVLVHFSWSKVEGAELYEIEIFKKDSPSVPVYSKTTPQKNFSTPITENGLYVWKVSALYGIEKQKFPSQESNFTIIDGTLASPEIIVANNGVETQSKMSILALQEGHPIAFWNPVDNAQKYSVIISSDPESKNILLSKTTPINSVKLEKPLPEGRYYVSVQAISGNTVSEFSPPTSIEIIPIKPLQPVFPQSDSKIYSSNQPITFRWKDENNGSNYQLLISSKKDFSSILIDTKTNKVYSEIILPKDIYGTLFWKVLLLDSSKTIAETPIQNFTILEAIQAPVPLSPILGEKLDVNNLDKLVFKWERQKEPRMYSINFYRMTGGVQSLISSWKTKERSLILTDISNLNLDNFAWEIRCETIDSEDTRISPKVISYFSIIQEKTLDVPTIKKMTSKGEY